VDSANNNYLNNVANALISHGYSHDGEFKNFAHLFVQESVPGIETNVMAVIDKSTINAYNPELFNYVSDNIRYRMISSGYKKCNILYLIISKGIQQEYALTDYDFNFWIIDTSSKKLIIFEDQPMDFNTTRNTLAGRLNLYATTMPIKNKLNDKKNGKRYIPFFTILIILINVIVFVWMEIDGSTQDSRYMMTHGAFSIYQFLYMKHYYIIFTNMFLHFGIEHIASNMMVLAFAGYSVEKNYGHFKFLVIYLATGICASAVSAMYYIIHHVFAVSAGASGAIYGVIGALAVTFVSQKNSAGNKTKALLVAFIIYNASKTDGSVDNMAHLGGLISGLLFGYIYHKCAGVKFKD